MTGKDPKIFKKVNFAKKEGQLKLMIYARFIFSNLVKIIKEKVFSLKLYFRFFINAINFYPLLLLRISAQKYAFLNFILLNQIPIF